MNDAAYRMRKFRSRRTLLRALQWASTCGVSNQQIAAVFFDHLRRMEIERNADPRYASVQPQEEAPHA